MPNESLKKYRNILNKTQEEMAKQWGISVSFYKKIECGVKKPSLDTIQKFKNNFPMANTEEIFLP